MVFEEDFRFWPENQDPDLFDYEKRVRGLLAFRKGTASSSQQSLPPAGQEDAAVPPWRSTKGRGKEKPETRFWAAATRGSSEPTAKDEGYHENVADLVRWATVAHRKECGHLLWVGWCPHRKPSQMGHGAHAILVSKRGMVSISEALSEGKIAKGHIDLELRHWLQKEGVAKTVQASHIVPPLGGYIQHESGCDPSQFGSHTAGRPSQFDEGTSAHGTRVCHDPKHRTKSLVVFAPRNGERVWHETPSDARLASDEFLWRSLGEPTASDSEEESESPTSIPFTPTTDDEDEDKAAWKSSKRFKRAERQFLMRQKFRVWVKDGEQAGVVMWAGVMDEGRVAIAKTTRASLFLFLRFCRLFGFWLHLVHQMLFKAGMGHRVI